MVMSIHVWALALVFGLRIHELWIRWLTDIVSWVAKALLCGRPACAALIDHHPRMVSMPCVGPPKSRPNLLNFKTHTPGLLLIYRHWSKESLHHCPGHTLGHAFYPKNNIHWNPITLNTGIYYVDIFSHQGMKRRTHSPISLGSCNKMMFTRRP